ncbi:acetyltransferase [Paenibacillus swuensis]|uniref:Acetyltransferase n=1 Tax=Paenibacillus swuensis TaxID=1178515 RepID=A0A172TII1_9BACL|nr:MBOAT family protein [Paenibacillus swuensis]ANE46851.1 acetyltransferase [Paenibacillus swuensis]
MLFNSYPFLFMFLPLTLIVYFLLNRFNYYNASRLWLAVASLFFYSYWDVHYLPLMMGSIVFNFLIGSSLTKTSEKPNAPRKGILIFGIIANVSLLIYYKYADFFITNINNATGSEIALLKLVLPLGISFFTFTQIAYLVDAFRNQVKEYNFVNYVLFVTFFPHLIAGPILHHKEMMPQFADKENKRFNYTNVAAGVFIFVLGLFKKVVIADSFAPIATQGFNGAASLGFIESWVTSLSYTLQLYFDFSGYSDMAIGIALLFNVVLPINFDSPYKALSIQDFWRRWHMTLSRFLRDYIYIPLGGNRKGVFRTYFNLAATFIIGGIWHGAGWTFIVWGVMHGVGQVIHRLWGKLGLKMPKFVAWFITFNFINITWVFFRAENMTQAFHVLKGMFGLHGMDLPSFFATRLNLGSLKSYGVEFVAVSPLKLLGIAAFLLVCFALKNTNELRAEMKPRWVTAIMLAALFVYSLLNFNQISEFLYFNF